MRRDIKNRSKKVTGALRILIFIILVNIGSCIPTNRIRETETVFSINHKFEIMAKKKNSAFKVIAAPVDSLEGVVPQEGALFLHEGLLYYCDKFGYHLLAPGNAEKEYLAVTGKDISGTINIIPALWTFFDTVFVASAGAFTPSIPAQSVTMVKDVTLHISASVYMKVSKETDLKLSLMKDGVEVQNLIGRPSEKNKPESFYFDFFESYLLGEVMTFEFSAGSNGVSYELYSMSTGFQNLTP